MDYVNEFILYNFKGKNPLPSFIMGNYLGKGGNMRKVIITLLIIQVFSVLSFAQNDIQKLCSSPEAQQFDF